MSEIGRQWRPAPVEIMAWCVLAWITALCTLWYNQAPDFGNDGYQYLSVADNLRQGRGAATSIAYFDAERARGTIPTPMTTFPPLYSALVASAELAGMRGEVAALLISQISFALLPLVLGLTALTGLKPLTFRMVSVLLITNSLLLKAADRIGSDALFTLVVGGAIVCFSRSFAAEESSGMRWQAGGWLLIGCSYWIRYAGLFIFAGALAFFVFRAARNSRRKPLLQALSSVLAMWLIGANFIRNIVVSGSWKGGVAKQSIDLAHFSPRLPAAVLYHLVFGESRAQSSIGWALLLGTAILLLLAIRGGQLAKVTNSLWWMLAAIVMVYVAAMIYANMTMVISFTPRYFIPLLPPVFLLLAMWLSAIERICPKRMLYLAPALLVTAGYVAMHFEGISVLFDRPLHAEVLGALRQPDSGGDLTGWMTQNIPPGAVITATNGQAAAYALHHPTLCITDPPFSYGMVTREQILGAMDRFGSQYLILFPEASDHAAPAQKASPFLQELLRGAAIEGLGLAARNRKIMIFRRGTATQAQRGD